MRILATVAMLLVCSTATAQTERGFPSPERLAEMGLDGIVILSDQQAQSIRVHGHPPNRWGNLYPFVKGISRLVQQPPRTIPAQVLLRW